MQKDDATNSSARVLGLGIIGCGTTARRYLAGLSGNWSVQAVMDADPPVARQFAKEIASPRHYADHWDLLGDDNVDAVLIASPIWIRGHQALEALEAGKHVLCHAPACLYLKDCDRLARTAADRDVALTTGIRLRQQALIAGATAMVEEGLVGEPILVRCDRSSYLSRAERQNAPRTWQELFSVEAVETTDLAHRILGEAFTVSADVQQAAPGSKKPEDIGNAIIQHERGLSIHHISRVSHQPPVERYLIDGVDASLIMDRVASGPDAYTVSLFRNGKFVRIITEECLHNGAGVSALDEFHNRILAKSPPDSGRAAVECVSAAFLSSTENRRISLPLLSGPHLPRLLPSGDAMDARRAIR